jgi:DNA-binding NarL/FixJ family response regulator
MRVVLVGPAFARQRLRARLPEGVEVLTETQGMASARVYGSRVDAYLVCADDDEDQEQVEGLTPRETDVLQLVATGLSNRAVAERLHVSDETVKFHLASIFGKLGASNRTDAVQRALRRGLIPL